MQFQGKKVIMENVLTLDIQSLLSEEFWYFCLKKLPCLFYRVSYDPYCSTVGVSSSARIKNSFTAVIGGWWLQVPATAAIATGSSWLSAGTGEALKWFVYDECVSSRNFAVVH